MKTEVEFLTHKISKEGVKQIWKIGTLQLLIKFMKHKRMFEDSFENFNGSSHIFLT